MATEARHTPTPWAYEQSSGAIYYADGDVEPVIAGINQDNASEEQADADGFHIVLAVNCHDEMLAALESAVASFEQLAKLGRIPENMKGFRDARAAVAKATGAAS